MAEFDVHRNPAGTGIASRSLSSCSPLCMTITVVVSRWLRWNRRFYQAAEFAGEIDRYSCVHGALAIKKSLGAL